MENQTNTNSKGLSKNFWIIIGALLLIAIIVFVVIFTSQDYEVDPVTTPEPIETEIIDDNGEEGFDLDDLVAEETDFTDPGTSVVDGGSSVVDNQVVDREGRPVRTDVTPMSPGAPQESNPLDEDEIPDDVIRLEVSAEGWTPNQFSVNAGDIITITVTSVDDFTHRLAFDDDVLSAITIGVSGGETRGMTFNAPNEPGEYEFRCSVPGHARRGEIGVMIVE